MSHSKYAVDLQELTKKYGDFTALDRLTLSLPTGKILGLIGPNGAGKTTAIKILVGLARPTSGSATIAGIDCTRQSHQIKRLVGYMPDSFGSYDNMRVHEYLDFFGAAFGIGRKVRRERIEAVMDTTGATYMRDRFVESLSHGMKQRVGIARTLLHDPHILILDEPANGLDPEARVEMRELLLRLAGMGKTLIVTSHILPELSRICDVIAIISKGQLRCFGTLEEITRNLSQQRMVEALLADETGLVAARAVIEPLLEPDAEITTSNEEAAIRFRTAKREAELGEILARLIHAGVKVTQFRELQTDLEDAFLSVTRADAATTQATAAQTATQPATT